MFYKCQSCGYTQDFKPTKEDMLRIFPDKIQKEVNGKVKMIEIEANQCPSCHKEDSLKEI